MVLAIWLWDRICVWNEIPRYILPRPGRGACRRCGRTSALLFVVAAGDAAHHLPRRSLLAVVGGVGLAVLFAQSKWVEMSLFPFAIVLQVTPIVAIFPLIIIYVDNQTAKLLLCAWIVAFFPILSNTTLGLNSRRPQPASTCSSSTARRAGSSSAHLRLPAAMPYFLGGLKIAGGLSLIGAVVAEFVAGAAGQSSGLASRIIEAGYRLNARGCSRR